MGTELHALPASGEQAGPGYAYFVASVAAVGGFLFGYDLLIINGAQIFLRDHFHLTPGELGFATSSAEVHPGGSSLRSGSAGVIPSTMSTGVEQRKPGQLGLALCVPHLCTTRGRCVALGRRELCHRP